MAEPEAEVVAGPEAAAGPQPVWVNVFPAKPNKLFTEEQRQLVVFLRYSQAVPCAECGKRGKHHWTMRCSFAALSAKPGMFTLAESGQVHLPMAPVCRAHLLKPAALPATPKRARASRAKY